MEQRLIDANALIDEFEWCKQQAAECNRKEWDEIITRVSKQPTVGAVHVVLCKDCKHAEINNLFGRDIPVCHRYASTSQAHYPDWFCADGERR